MTDQTTIPDYRKIRKAFERHIGPGWTLHAMGPTGIALHHKGSRMGVIVTSAVHPDGNEWFHASVACETKMPTYDDLCVLHAAVWGQEGFAYQVFAPAYRHVNIHAHALHLWGRTDGANVLPDFGERGTI